MMSGEFFTMFLAVVVFYLVTSLEVEGQSTVDDRESCSSLLTSDDVANLIREGVEKVVASNRQRCITMEPSKHSLVSALSSKHRLHRESNLQLCHL